MKGIAQAVKNSNGLLLLDGGTITGLEQFIEDLYAEWHMWYFPFMDK